MGEVKSNFGKTNYLDTMGDNYDAHITVFSPEGKLLQIEYCFKAIRSSNLTSVGLRGGDSVVVVTEKRVQDKLIDPDAMTNLYSITDHIGVLTTGRQPDCIGLVSRLRQEAMEYRENYGHEVPVNV